MIPLPNTGLSSFDERGVGKGSNYAASLQGCVLGAVLESSEFPSGVSRQSSVVSRLYYSLCFSERRCP